MRFYSPGVLLLRLYQLLKMGHKLCNKTFLFNFPLTLQPCVIRFGCSPTFCTIEKAYFVEVNNYLWLIFCFALIFVTFFWSVDSSHKALCHTAFMTNNVINGIQNLKIWTPSSHLPSRCSTILTQCLGAIECDNFWPKFEGKKCCFWLLFLSFMYKTNYNLLVFFSRIFHLYL